jgi:hypothetical protein
VILGTGFAKVGGDETSMMSKVAIAGVELGCAAILMLLYEEEFGGENATETKSQMLMAQSMLKAGSSACPVNQESVKSMMSQHPFIAVPTAKGSAATITVHANENRDNTNSAINRLSIREHRGDEMKPRLSREDVVPLGLRQVDRDECPTLNRCFLFTLPGCPGLHRARAPS